jgi:hypothetical protein
MSFYLHKGFLRECRSLAARAKVKYRSDGSEPFLARDDAAATKPNISVKVIFLCLIF